MPTIPSVFIVRTMGRRAMIIVWRMVLIVFTIVTPPQVVIVAVTVITRVLGDFQPIVVQTHIAGEKGPIVFLKFLVESVATHGIGNGGVVVIVGNFLSIYTHNHTHTQTHTS